MEPESLQSSYLTTKNHGLHKLPLCKACQKLNLRSMCAPEGFLYLEDVWTLLKTQRKCRFCAFVAQTIRGTRTSSLRNQLVARDLVCGYKYPMYLTLANRSLNVNLGEYASLGLNINLGRYASLADFELYCDPGMKTN